MKFPSCVQIKDIEKVELCLSESGAYPEHCKMMNSAIYYKQTIYISSFIQVSLRFERPKCKWSIFI